jgi:hypothetical protein
MRRWFSYYGFVGNKRVDKKEELGRVAESPEKA